MEHSQQTIQQIDRTIDRTISKFPPCETTDIITDIHFRAIPDSGELLSFNDNAEEVNRGVIDEWINNTDENFYNKVASLLRQRLNLHAEKINNMGIMKPFSFILEDDEQETIAELFIADDDTIIIGGDIMENLDTDLDSFFNDLMKED